MLQATLLPLRSDRASLRPLRRGDSPAFAEGTTDADVQAHAHLPEPSYTPASAAAMIDGAARAGLERGDLAVLAIADTDTDEFAGSLVLFDVSDDAAEVGFWMRPDHRGTGLTAAALDLAAQFASNSGLAWLTARTATDNTASQRLLIRAGFIETSRAKGATPSGQEADLIHYVRYIGAAPTFPLETERLRLRLHTAGDAPWLHRVYSNPGVARYLLDEPWSEDDAIRHVAERQAKTGLDSDSGALALVIERDGTPAGDVSLWLTDREHRIAEIRCVLDPEHGRKGFAAEAAQAVLDLSNSQDLWMKIFRRLPVGGGRRVAPRACR